MAKLKFKLELILIFLQIYFLSKDYTFGAKLSSSSNTIYATTTSTTKPTRYLTTSTTPVPTTTQTVIQSNSCPILEINESEVVQCYNERQKPTVQVNCTAETSPENTVAEFACAQFWKPPTGYEKSLRKICINKSWIEEPRNFSCEFDCGVAGMYKRISYGEAILLKSETPWVVEIFQSEINNNMTEPAATTKNYKHVCEGNLITRRAILTAAQCVTFPNTAIERRPEDFKINLGRLHKTVYSGNRDLFLDVQKIVLHYEFDEDSLNSDLAIIWLAKPVKLDEYTHPICLPSEDEEVDIGSEGKITIVEGEYASSRKATVISSLTCRQYSNLANFVKPTKFCTTTTNDSSICTTHGNGLSFSHGTNKNKWFLQGIRTGPFPKSSYDSICKGPLLFTKMAPYRSWIDRELGREPPIYLPTTTTPAPPTTTLPPCNSSISSNCYNRTTNTITNFNSNREREPLTPEPNLVPRFSTKSPQIVNIESNNREIVTIPPSNTNNRRTENPLSISNNYNNKPSKNNFDPLADIDYVLSKATQSSIYDKRVPNPTPAPSYYPVVPTRAPVNERPSAPVQNNFYFTTTTEKFHYEEQIAVRRNTTTTLNQNVATFHCPPLPKTNGVSQICRHDEYEDYDDCSNGGQSGTEAVLKCENYYKSVYGPPSVKMECQNNKRWSAPRPFGCKLECGISARPRKSFIVNGIISDRVSWPWHATIFRKRHGEFLYICGGTLISKSLILTAAHCVTRPGTSSPVNKEDIRVVLASNSSNYTQNLFDEVSRANIFYVKTTKIPDTYNGVTFESDIAVLQLEYEVELSDYVRPVCFPFHSEDSLNIEQIHLSPGSNGQTVGFGIDETMHISKVMKETSLPVVSHRDCGEVLGRFPSHSQFCAGHLNGTAVCNGDSGSGIFFSEGTGFINRYIIQGIVSFGDHHASGSRLCNHNSYAVFTKVSSFAAWVQQQLDLLEPLFR